MKNIKSSEEFNGFMTNEPILLAYFGSDSCTVCHATKPKVEDLLKKLPNVSACYCPADHNPELAGQHLIFTVPAIVIFHHGHEIYRSARFLDLQYVEKLLDELTDQEDS